MYLNSSKATGLTFRYRLYWKKVCLSFKYIDNFDIPHAILLKADENLEMWRDEFPLEISDTRTWPFLSGPVVTAFPIGHWKRAYLPFCYNNVFNFGMHQSPMFKIGLRAMKEDAKARRCQLFKQRNFDGLAEKELPQVLEMPDFLTQHILNRAD